MRAAFDAFVEAVEVVPNLTLYDTRAPQEATGVYAVAGDSSPRHEGYRQDATATVRELTFTLMGVGASRKEALWSVEKAEQVLTRKRLTILGRTSTPLRKIGGGQVIWDDDSEAPQVYTVTDVWRCRLDMA